MSARLRLARPLLIRLCSSRVCVVTGASSGIGRALSLALAGRGCRLVLGARREQRLLELAEDCRQRGAKHVTVVAADLSQEQGCRLLIERAVSAYGSLDTLVLNAGLGQSFFLEAMQPGMDVRQFMDVNYYGCVYPTIAALPHLQKSASGGRIVVISSLGG